MYKCLQRLSLSIDLCALEILHFAYNIIEYALKMVIKNQQEQLMLCHTGHNLYIFCTKKSFTVQLLYYPLLMVDLVQAKLMLSHNFSPICLEVTTHTET